MLLAVAIVLALFVVSPGLGIALVVAAGIVEVAEVFVWRRFLLRYRVSTGAEALVGERVEVVTACDPQGRVRLRGELWNARSPVPLAAGEAATVTAVDGLTLRVNRAE